MIIISDDDSPVVRNPTERALDDISSPVVIPKAIVLSIHVPMVLAMRNQETDPSFLEPFSSGITVIRFVCDHSLGSCAWSSRASFGDSDLSKSLIKERDLSRRGRVGMASERNTLAIDQYHALCSLSPLGLPDCRAPFFAGKKLASTNTSSQSRIPSRSRSERKARHISLRTPSSYHSRKRRQQVDGCGYRSGRSLHLAPVFRTQRIPSNTNRSSALGRPPFLPPDFFGIWRLTFRHCSSVKYTTRSLTGLTSGEPNIPKRSEKQTLNSLAISRAYHSRRFCNRLYVNITLPIIVVLENNREKGATFWPRCDFLWACHVNETCLIERTARWGSWKPQPKRRPSNGRTPASWLSRHWVWAFLTSK
jgi:hypothetical protein